MTQINKADLSKPVTEGSANSIACEALHEKEMCIMLENIGSCKIKSHDLNLGDVYYARSSIINEDPYTTGMAMFKFLEEKHPEITDDISEYFMLGDKVKWHDIFNKIWDIDNKNPEEFKEWIDSQDVQYTKCDSSADIIHDFTSLVDIL
uniref:Uncharacterized protein n=1 Tax=Wolbachia endosymbiont of Aleurodicus floccissimus TaxID=2152762 RepID=A0A3B0JFA1_9RICK